jgi:hypothetical protein
MEQRPAQVFDSQAEYDEYLEDLGFQLPPKEHYVTAVEVPAADYDDLELRNAEVTENYPFAPEPW